MKKRYLFVAASCICLTGFSQRIPAAKDSVYMQFKIPPKAAKPRVWWHWMNGNITKDGIRKDLEWMNRSGIGGFQNFDASLMTPQIVEKRLTYMTPEWKNAFLFTTKLADSLNLEMAIAGSPGWSESGGPWVKPEDGMKKIVWTETRVKAGTEIINLTKPSDTTGPFQNLPKAAGMGLGGSEKTLPRLYRDIAVIAYKLPDADKSLEELQATVTSSAGNFNLAQLTDGDIATSKLLPSDSATGFAWIQFNFPQPQTINAVTMVGGGDMGFFGLTELNDTRSLEASNDGVHFTHTCFIPAGRVLQQTIDVPATTSRYFRITIKNPPAPSGIMAMFGGQNKAPLGTDIAELVLHTVPRVQMVEEKAAFAPAGTLFKKATPVTTAAVLLSDIIDISGALNPDGTIHWKVPAGNWMIVRFGYSLTGMTNSPASPEATGLEVDKLDPVAIKSYFSTYLDQYKDATGGLMGKKGGLQFMVTDSWEAGTQNWTANLPAEFKQRRGYALLPWLPVLTGHIVQSAEASDQFLFDYRQTLGDLVVAYHYDALTKILAARGMQRYSESHEDRRAMIADGMEVKRTAAIPMAAMWLPSPFNGGDQTDYQADIRESASVAHIYGQNLVAAESLTAFGIGGFAWSYDPSSLKSTADLELANGLNRFIIHTSVHQPTDDKLPGIGLGPFGQWFNRHDTWAENARVWSDYLARSSYLLQQGKFVADIVYYYGEDNNITSLFGKKLPSIPQGYNYDFINADALIHLLSVQNGQLITPSGMRYRVLILDSNASKMSLPVLRKLKDLVNAGATITGIKPTATPSLSDNQDEFNELVQEIWDNNRKNVSTAKSVSEVLKATNIHPDFEYTKTAPDTKLLYVHRKTNDRDIYWVNNRNDRIEDIKASFRVAGKIPELWFAETGKAESLSYHIANGVTRVKLHMEPNDALFIVFKNKADKDAVELPAVKVKNIASINGEWTIHFQKDRGAPDSVRVNQLSSWTNNANEGIKYFSGTASYTKTIAAPADWFNKDDELWLNLGEVKNLAEIIVNGKSLGVLWRKPFRINLTGALKVGVNTLEIKVTNLWVNRLIGDAQPGVNPKITFTTMPFYQANSPLLASGILGPVQVMSVSRK